MESFHYDMHYCHEKMIFFYTIFSKTMETLTLLMGVMEYWPMQWLLDGEKEGTHTLIMMKDGL